MTSLSESTYTPAVASEQSIRWMGLALRVPGDWHIRQHGVSPAAGKLVFVDRRVQRMEILWSRPSQEPDIARMVRHGIEAVQNDQPNLHISPHLPGGITGWEGFSYESNPRVYRVLHYHADDNVLLQVTLSLDGIREDTHRQARGLLSALTVAENPDRATHWRAFGLDCRLPAACVLRHAKVHPMDVRFEFDLMPERKHGFARPGSVVLRRLGMAGDWYEGDLLAYARRRTTGLRSEIRMEAGSTPPVCRVTTRVKAPGFPGKFGAKHTEILRLWHNPATNSLFELTLTHVPQSEAVLSEIHVDGVAEWVSTGGMSPARAAFVSETEGDALVEGIPVRNAAVIEEPAQQGAVLRVPLRARWWTSGIFRWIFPVRDTRSFGVDAFGAEVWSDCDGTRTVESICERFARRHAVSYDEAKASVYHFLRTLTQRELILIQLPQNRLDHS